MPGPVLDVLRRLKAAGHAAYLVGGAVRDLMLDRPSHSAADWDIATSARPEAVEQLFEHTIPTGVEHGTVTVVVDHEPLEVTTFRGEGAYSDARRPDAVHFLDDIDEDLARRDFTINAMAWDPLEAVFRDPFGGREDLARHLVRAVGDPLERFAEDGLRPMRAVRFATVLGFDIDRPTLEAIPQRLAQFERVAMERVSAELMKLLLAEDPAPGVRWLAETDLLRRIAPELEGQVEAAAVATAQVPPEERVRLAAFLHPLAPEAAARRIEALRLPKRLQRAVSTLLAALPDTVPAGDAGLRRLLARVGRTLAPDFLALWPATRPRDPAVAAAAERARRLLAESPPLSIQDLAISGADVMAHLGLGPGPQVGRHLARLLDAVLEDPRLNEREALLARLGDADEA